MREEESVRYVRQTEQWLLQLHSLSCKLLQDNKLMRSWQQARVYIAMLCCVTPLSH